MRLRCVQALQIMSHNNHHHHFRVTPKERIFHCILIHCSVLPSLPPSSFPLFPVQPPAQAPGPQGPWGPRNEQQTLPLHKSRKKKCVVLWQVVLLLILPVGWADGNVQEIQGNSAQERAHGRPHHQVPPRKVIHLHIPNLSTIGPIAPDSFWINSFLYRQALQAGLPGSLGQPSKKIRSRMVSRER